MNKNVGELLNTQINKEMYSAYLYLDMAIYYEKAGLSGFANWYQIQAKEEMDHAMLIMKYLQNNEYDVTLEKVAKPDKVFEKFEDPLHASLEHEKYVTSLIHNIYGAAYEVKDFRTMKFLDWFVDEQGEEEKNASDMITRYDLFGHETKGLYELDKEYAARVYTAPSLVLE